MSNNFKKIDDSSSKAVKYAILVTCIVAALFESICTVFMWYKSDEAIYLAANGQVTAHQMQFGTLSLRIAIVGIFFIKHLFIRLPCLCCGVFKPQKNCCLTTFSVITLIFVISDVIMISSKSENVLKNNVFGTVGKVNFFFSIITNLLLFCLLILLYKKLPSALEYTLSKIANTNTASDQYTAGPMYQQPPPHFNQQQQHGYEFQQGVVACQNTVAPKV